MLELRQGCHERSHKPTLRGGQIERQTRLRNQGRVPGGELPERRHQILRRTPPARQLGHQHRVDLPSLGQRHHPRALHGLLAASLANTRQSLLIYSHHLVPGTLGMRYEVSLLTVTVLIRG